MNYIDRLEKLIRELGLSQAKFAHAIDVVPATITGIKHGDFGISEKNLRNIVAVFNVNPEWLVTGEGDMFLSGGQTFRPLYRSSELPEITEGVPVYEARASAGSVEMYQDLANLQPVDYVSIPGFKDCDFIIPVWGHSMYPTMENGAYVIGKWIKDKQSISWGECYYVEWKDYRMIKRVLKDKEEGWINLHSDNEEARRNGDTQYSPIRVHRFRYE